MSAVGLSPLRLGFDPRLVYVRFVVVKTEMGNAFPRALSHVGTVMRCITTLRSTTDLI